MGSTSWVSRIVVVAAVLSVGAPSHAATTQPPPEPCAERPSTVVVKVSDGGFRWVDAGLGAAAALGATLLALGLVLALRPDRGTNGNLGGAHAGAGRSEVP